MANRKIKDFFNGRFFEIPKYQRGYTWELQNINDLFDDIEESIESHSNHYLGTIVLSKSDLDDEKFYVVDGQQRITTISLIINSLIKKISKEDSVFYKRFYLKEGNRYRITPLNRDQQFFIDLLIGNIDIPENKSQRYLIDAYNEINNKINLIEDKLKFLRSIENLEIMEFVENSEGDAIRIFQTVNDRGKPLSNMEKAKSLLIYFSNRYLSSELDNKINEYFGDIFEYYDDIKNIGETSGINLIKNKDFNEDNLMRYHFTTYSQEDYDPTAYYVLCYLKKALKEFRSSLDFSGMKDFINYYVESLRKFFKNCKEIIEKVKIEPPYYKLFVILNLSATLYPLITKLQELGMLEKKLSGKNREKFVFRDLVGLIEVRVYKTRGTDPKADISRFIFGIDKQNPENIENWLTWFNSRWMSKEEFKSNLLSRMYGNRALVYIFITYCEELIGKNFEIDQLQEFMGTSPSIEHILPQTPVFVPTVFGFKDEDEFSELKDSIGNLTLLERGLNSSVQNRNAIEKIDGYTKSNFLMTSMLASEIDHNKGFTKKEMLERSKKLANFCLKYWWSDKSNEPTDNNLIEYDEDIM